MSLWCYFGVKHVGHKAGSMSIKQLIVYIVIFVSLSTIVSSFMCGYRTWVISLYDKNPSCWRCYMVSECMKFIMEIFDVDDEIAPYVLIGFVCW